MEGDQSALSAPDHWPFYYLRFAQVRRLAIKLAEGRQASSALLPRSVVTSGATAELSLEGSGGRLRGQADRVVTTEEGVCIEDYKTGVIYEPTEDPQQVLELKADYRAQLLIYAALYRDQSGIWPVSARVVPLQGDPVTIRIDPDEAVGAAQVALDLLARYNDQLTRVDVWSLGSPSPTVCRMCSYRGACARYWCSVDAAWEPEDQPSAMGVASSMDVLGDGTFQLVLDVERGSVPRGRARVRGLQEDQAVAGDGLPVVGTTLRVVRLRSRQADSGDDVWATSGTEIWAIAPGESR